MESVLNKTREVEIQEKAAEQAKKEASRSGLHILTEVEKLKQMVHQARETYDKVLYSCSYCFLKFHWGKKKKTPNPFPDFGSMLGKFMGRNRFLPLKHGSSSPVFSNYQMKEINLSQL